MIINIIILLNHYILLSQCFSILSIIISINIII